MTTPQTTPELLACPFCGGAPEHEEHMDESLWSHDIVPWRSVRCSTCEIGTRFICEGATPNECEAWNARAIDSGDQLLGMYAIQADEIKALLDKHAPDGIGNIKDRIEKILLAATQEMAAPIEGVRREYYYEVPACRATDENSPECICWHAEGTGPLPNGDGILAWRNVKQAESPQPLAPPPGYAPEQKGWTKERGYHALVQVVYELQNDGSYSDDEGEETQALVDLVLRMEEADAATQPPASALPLAVGVEEIPEDVINYVKGIYDFLESTSLAGFAEEAFRLPPAPTRNQRSLSDLVSGHTHGQLLPASGPDQRPGEPGGEAVGVAALPPPGRMVPMTTAQIDLAVRNAQIAFCLDKFKNFEEALVRKTEAHHGIKEGS